jgi:hypothetical protein
VCYFCVVEGLAHKHIHLHALIHADTALGAEDIGNTWKHGLNKTTEHYLAKAVNSEIAEYDISSTLGKTECRDTEVTG